MARVHQAVAAKDYPAHGIKKGDTYYHWKPYRSAKRYSLTPPTRQQRTDREELIALYDAQDAADEIKFAGRDYDDVSGDIDDVKDRLQEAADAAQDKYDNLPENFQNGERGQQLEQFVSECEDAIGELDNIKDELDPENRDDDSDACERTDLSDVTWPEEF